MLFNEAPGLQSNKRGITVDLQFDAEKLVAILLLRMGWEENGVRKNRTDFIFKNFLVRFSGPIFF